MVIKKDGSRQSFDLNKILGGLVRACEKRPVAMASLEDACGQIEQRLSNSMEREIDSRRIGELAMESLKEIDQVAYVRFASVYRQFKDIGTFMSELTKLLEEKGWPAFDWRDMGQAERAIGQRRLQVMDLLYQHCPDPQLIEVFRLKYDYHNIKAILKGDAQRVDPLPLLSDAALIPPKDLARMMRENELDAMNPIMAEAVLQAKEMLDRTSDPQLSDMVLDRAETRQTLETAQASGSDFLLGYVRRSIDCNNLRTALRLSRMGKGLDYAQRAVNPGGSIAPEAFYEPMTPEYIDKLLAGTPLEPATESARRALEGGGFAPLDKACDDLLIEYARSARMVPFGEQTAIAYLLASEAEFAAVRSVLAGKNAGLSTDKIMERLRISYVV